MRTIVIGVGNPVRGDDAVGIFAARDIARRTADRTDVEACELHVGGLRLMEAMAGYRKAIVIDAIRTEGGTPGAIYRIPLAELTSTRNSYSQHDESLSVALAVGREVGLELPGEVLTWAVEAGDVDNFSLELTGPVEQAVREVVEQVLGELDQAGSVPA
jgi:hydrogenase maturation protease